MTFIFADGCKVPLDYLNTERTLDICNCSAYYITRGLLDKTRHVCPQNQLWNHQVGICEDSNRILNERLCNRKYPWERCSKDTQASKKLEIREKCISDGRYSEQVAAQYDDKLGYQTLLSLPSHIVVSNLGLAAAAFVAGCVVTLVLLAIILTICRPRGGSSFGKKTSSAKTVTKTKKKKKTVITEGEVAIQYEDIDQEVQPTSHGYKPMFSGAHLQLQGDSFQDTHPVFQPSSSVMSSATSHSQWSTTSNQPPKPPTRPVPVPSSTGLQHSAGRPLAPSRKPPTNSATTIHVETKLKTPPKLPVKPRY